MVTKQSPLSWFRKRDLSQWSGTFKKLINTLDKRYTVTHWQALHGDTLQLLFIFFEMLRYRMDIQSCGSVEIWTHTVAWRIVSIVYWLWLHCDKMDLFSRQIICGQLALGKIDAISMFFLICWGHILTTCSKRPLSISVVYYHWKWTVSVIAICFQRKLKGLRIIISTQTTILFFLESCSPYLLSWLFEANKTFQIAPHTHPHPPLFFNGDISALLWLSSSGCHLILFLFVRLRTAQDNVSLGYVKSKEAKGHTVLLLSQGFFHRL